MIGINYDLRAPDYSYLVIVELKDFYYQKFAAFRSCKGKTIHLLTQLQQYLEEFKDKATTISNTIIAVGNSSTDNSYDTSVILLAA